MKMHSFSSGWSYAHADKNEPLQPVLIPHDAMLLEPRHPDNTGGGNVCWFGGGEYRYEKRFTVPAEWEKQHITLEFEGVYRHAEVLINGQKAGGCAYGFYINADPYLRYGVENVVEVLAHNADHPNSRWYSGAGIYRPVNLYSGPQAYIHPNGVKLKTQSIDPAVVEVTARVQGEGIVKAEILWHGQVVTANEGKAVNDTAQFSS